jgi:hypothetical protein
VGQRPGNSPAHTNSLYTSTQLATSCPSLAGSRYRQPRVLGRPRGHPIGCQSRHLGRRLITRAPRDRGQRVADLARREPIVPRARLALPLLQPRGALHADRLRLPLTHQHRRETVQRLTVPRTTQPPLPPMRSLAIPPSPHNDPTTMPPHRTRRDLHTNNRNHPTGYIHPNRLGTHVRIHIRRIHSGLNRTQRDQLSTRRPAANTHKRRPRSHPATPPQMASPYSAASTPTAERPQRCLCGHFAVTKSIEQQRSKANGVPRSLVFSGVFARIR